jgi:predicted nucleotidyltransferase
MGDRTLDAGTLSRLRAALRTGPPLRLAVLFGSAARGQRRPESDIDVAVLAGEAGLDEAQELVLARALVLAAGTEVDLVRLEQASTLLKWQIATKGTPLSRPPPRASTKWILGVAYHR